MWYPTFMPGMKKTSVYLTDDEVARLSRVARIEGRSQSEIIRRAIGSYVAEGGTDRDFALFDSGDGPGGSVADIPEEELLRGFGA